MAAKRLRIIRSSSFGDTSLLNQVLTPTATVSPEHRFDVGTAPGIPVTARPPSVAAERYQSPPRILTLSSPESEKEKPEGQVGNFLEKCYFCKRRIAEDDEVFMYSYLRAFCTYECRAKQIVMDKVGEKVFGQSAERMTQSGKMNNVKLFGVQL
ncbi:uncharacterized protein LOC132172271 [Corylus avellana]|uniref:uncharacterized protein LOC132172271 n=1 Tax=Corylus avellana TaxID=13451 RepID=UPI00286C5C20|nr:uncharacterized protein LOC132172271 [Corylus avellana]